MAIANGTVDLRLLQVECFWFLVSHFLVSHCWRTGGNEVLEFEDRLHGRSILKNTPYREIKSEIKLSASNKLFLAKQAPNIVLIIARLLAF